MEFKVLMAHQTINGYVGEAPQPFPFLDVLIEQNMRQVRNLLLEW